MGQGNLDAGLLYLYNEETHLHLRWKPWFGSFSQKNEGK